MIDLQILTDNQTPIEELKLGKVRQGYSNIRTFFIKNLGNTTAKNVLLEAVNKSPDDKSETWHEFSLDGKVFSPQLSVGDILPGQFVKAQERRSEHFYSQSESSFYKLLGAVKTTYDGDSLNVYQDVANSQARGRYEIDIPQTKNINIEFSMAFDKDSEVFESIPSNQQKNSLLMFLLRGNSSGEGRDKDGTGYLCEFFSNPGKEKDGRYWSQMKITKNALGVWSPTDSTNSYGVQIAGTNFDSKNTWFEYTPHDIFNLILTNDEEGCPTFQLLKNGVPIRIAPYETKNGKKTFGSSATVFKDQDKTYNGYGRTFYDINLQKGALGYRLSNVILSYDSLNSPIYIKTFVQNGENGKDYLCNLKVSYEE